MTTIKTLKTKNIVKSCMFGLLACFLAVGVVSPALAAGDTSRHWGFQELLENDQAARALNHEK